MVRNEESTAIEFPKPHEVLRAKRMERGISLEKAREDTKISQKYIRALEEGTYEIFPAKVYLRGFFLSYCKYLGILDTDKLLPYLMQTASGVAEVPTSEEVRRRRIGTPVVQPRKEREEKRSSAVISNDEEGLWARFSLWVLEGHNKILLMLVFPTILLASFFGIYSYVKYRQYRSQPADALDVPSLLGQQKPPSAKGVVPEPVIVGKKANVKLALDLSTKSEPSWMQVEIDGEIAFQGILPAHQKRSFAALSGAKLRLGNPKAIDIKVNDTLWPLSKEDLEKTPLEVNIKPENLTR